LVVHLNRREADISQPDIGADAVAEAEAIVKDVFKAEYAQQAQSQKLAFAAQLLQQGMDASDDMAARYVLLREAAEQAVQAGDAATAMKALSETARSYVVDGPALKLAALSRAASAASTPEANRALAQSYLALFDEYLAAENFEGAKKVLAPGEAAARNAKNVPLVLEVQARGRELPEMQKLQANAKAAAEILKAKPEDAAPNGVLGRYTSFVRGDWEKGLACLAQSNDTLLQKLAKDELARPTEPAGWVGVGDGWWDLAEKEKLRTVKAHLRAHACQWYEKARTVVPVDAKSRVEKRMQLVRGAAEPAQKQESH
jgi:hypothetical protein